jgi:hypothetical protein
MFKITVAISELFLPSCLAYGWLVLWRIDLPFHSQLQLCAHKYIYVHLIKEINFLNFPEGAHKKKFFLCALK